MNQSTPRALRVIFAGTPEFARTALERIHAAGHTIALVLTQPDRPAGRGMKMQTSAVKQFALAQGVPLVQARSLRLQGKFPEDAVAARLAIEQAQADVMVVAAYGLILPQWALDAMRNSAGLNLGCINIHGSLLPRWRGAAPIHRAIEAGDSHSGVTIMQMDAGLDTGDFLRMQRIAIDPHDTTGSLHDRVAELGAELVLQVLQDAAEQKLQAVPQPAEGVTYAHKIEKHEAEIDWNSHAETIDRRIRAFNPFPGAFTRFNGEVVKVWAAHVDIGKPQATPSKVLQADASGIVVATAGAALVLTELQRAGGKRLAVADFLRGFVHQQGLALNITTL